MNEEGQPGGRDLQSVIRRTLLITAVFAIPIVFSAKSSVAGDPDIWWHLRTGEYILQQRAVPFTDPFSTPAAGKMWLAYSWLFELAIFGMYRAFGLLALVFYQAGMGLAITAALYVAVSHRAKSIVGAVGITCVAIVAILPDLSPRPWLLSILAFTLTLDMLLRTRADGKWKRLLWVVGLFVVWANVHIQFIYGLFAVGLLAVEATAAPVLERMGWEKPAMGRNKAWLAFALCLAATLVSPYSWRNYQVVFQYMSQSGAYNLVSELRAPQFRSICDYAALVLTAGAFFALGWRKQKSLYMAALLLVTMLVGFRSARDVWFVCVTAAMIAAGASSATTVEYRLSVAQRAITAALLVVVFATTIAVRTVSNSELNAFVSRNYPVGAADLVSAERLTGPLFNDFDWGGFLIWRLRRLPVAVDGRTNIYGDSYLAQSVNTWEAREGWRDDPILDSAGVVVGSKKWPLTSALRSDSRFRLVYEDGVAAVYVRQTRQLR